MVLSLRDESMEPDPILAAWDKFAERVTESMTKFVDQFAETMKQALLKSNPKQNRKVLICGYTEEEDCLCVATETMWSVYHEEDDQHDVMLGFEEEMNHQNQFQIHDDAPVVPEIGYECLQTKNEAPSPRINDVGDQLILDKVSFIPNCDSSSPSLATNTEAGMFAANTKKVNEVCKVFDKIPKPMGYTTDLNPDPPDGFGQLTHSGTTKQWDPVRTIIGTFKGQMKEIGLIHVGRNGAMENTIIIDHLREYMSTSVLIYKNVKFYTEDKNDLEFFKKLASFTALFVKGKAHITCSIENLAMGKYEDKLIVNATYVGITRKGILAANESTGIVSKHLSSISQASMLRKLRKTEGHFNTVAGKPFVDVLEILVDGPRDISKCAYVTECVLAILVVNKLSGVLKISALKIRVPHTLGPATFNPDEHDGFKKIWGLVGIMKVIHWGIIRSTLLFHITNKAVRMFFKVKTNIPCMAGIEKVKVKHQSFTLKMYVQIAEVSHIPLFSFLAGSKVGQITEQECISSMANVGSCQCPNCCFAYFPP